MKANTLGDIIKHLNDHESGKKVSKQSLLNLLSRAANDELKRIRPLFKTPHPDKILSIRSALVSWIKYIESDDWNVDENAKYETALLEAFVQAYLGSDFYEWFSLLTDHKS